MVAASPHEDNALETISSFNFGKRCKMIQVQIKQPILLNEREMRKELKKLKIQIEHYKKKGGTSTASSNMHITGTL